MYRGHGWGQRHDWGGKDRRDIIKEMCECPRCGYKMSRLTAVPCSSMPCPRCGTPMEESGWR